jgi:hypothetical protein
MTDMLLEHVILRQGTINVVGDSVLFSRATRRAAATACTEEDPDANGDNHQDDNENEPPSRLTHPVANGSQATSATWIACKSRSQAKTRANRTALQTQATTTTTARRLR